MKPVYYLSPFIPREWIAAHGLSPCRLTLSAEHAREGGSAGMCPYAQALTARTVDWDGAPLILATTCDQMRRAAEQIALAWARSGRGGVLFVFNLPATLGPGAPVLYRSELQRLGRFLVRHGGCAPDPASDRDILDFAAEAHRESLHPDCRDESAETPAGLVPVALVGGPLLLEHRQLQGVIQRAGGRVVLDGTEGGERTSPRFSPQPTGVELLESLTTAYFNAIPDAFRRPDTQLCEWLARRVREQGVRGVIFHAYTWCDQWRAAQHHLAERAGLPALFLELGPAPQLEGHVRTRIEAFLESLV